MKMNYLPFVENNSNSLVDLNYTTLKWESSYPPNKLICPISTLLHCDFNDEIRDIMKHNIMFQLNIESTDLIQIDNNSDHLLIRILIDQCKVPIRVISSIKHIRLL